MKLLIVDDSLVIRNKINRGLLTRFEKVLRAENGQHAMDIAKTEKPDVVTMDLTMPKMDGVQCIEQLSKLSPKPKILVISALADKAIAIAALKLGASGFLCKPFTDHDLTDAISKVIEVSKSV